MWLQTIGITLLELSQALEKLGGFCPPHASGIQNGKQLLMFNMNKNITVSQVQDMFPNFNVEIVSEGVVIQVSPK